MIKEKNMKEQDIIKIRNTAGVLDIKLIKQLNLRDVTRGFCEDMDFSGRCRFEFHKRRGDHTIVTLCERSSENKIIVANIEYGEITVFLGEMLGTEKDELLFETVEQ